MALDFGKLAFSISFNPTAAFPLDARSYFESLESARLAAASATEVGKADSSYYFGQTLTVVENQVATFYVIQPDGTLAPVGEKLKIDANVFDYDDNNRLTLLGKNQAPANSAFVKNADGTMGWKEMVDAYTKVETDAKIKEAVSAASHMKRKIVTSIDDIDINAANADSYVYMVPTGLQEEANKYYEYMVIVLETTPGEEIRFIEKVGSWDINLDNYATIPYVTEALSKKVDKEPGSRLITEEEINKLLSIAAGAEANYIKSVSSDFSVQEGELQLNTLDITKINGLEDALNKKVTAVEGYTLLSPTDKAKLDKLVIENGNLEISGSVNAENVVNLADWITSHVNTVPGLSEQNFTTSLRSKLESMIYVSSVDTEELKVENEKLSIVKVDPTKVTGLQDALNSKVSQEVFNTLNTKVTTILDDLNNYVTKTQYDSDLEELWDVLTWKDI